MKKEPLGKNADKKIVVYNRFKGVDYAHAPANVSTQRCVDGLNMVRSEVGKVQKRTGFEYDKIQWAEKINGVHFLQQGEQSMCLIHSGTNFYADSKKIFSGAKNARSHSIQMGDRLYILDGAKFMVFDGSSVYMAKDHAYIPTTYINRTPSGGGKLHEQANILTGKRREGFIADGKSNTYVLSQRYLDSGSVYAEIYKDDGTYYTVTNGNGCSVDTVAGTVTFASAPPLSKLVNQDNVYITYSKATAENGNVLDKCTVMTVFGAGGRPDTLFLSGNPDYPGREWFSQPDNPTFFGQQNTDLAGSDNSPVRGYSTKGDKLFVHRQDNERHLNIVVRQCYGQNSNFYSYPVVTALQGPGALAADTFVNMANDALFLTDSGIYAITKNDATQDHYTQLRSLFINPVLLKNSDLTRATAVAFNDFYVLAAGKDIYLLDTLQKSYDDDKEYSDYQYECYHWQISESICMLFVENGRLCFVTDNGKIGRFYTDYSSPVNFSDDGKAITAVWQTGEFTSDNYARIKNIYKMWVVCAASQRTSVTVQAQIKGRWMHMFSDMTTSRYFQWSSIQWSKFTWATDKTPKLIKRTARVRNVNKTAFRLENSSLGEPFGIYEFGLEYDTGAYYR